MKLRDRPSPNFDARPGAGGVEMLILHYTGMRTAAEALDRLCDPAAKVSAHYLIDEDGAVWRLVDEARRAWHAGLSCWRDCRDVNGASIGIELVNPGHEFGYRAFPEAQMRALEELARGILKRHPMPPRAVLGHSDVAPQRKQDPGELFDWPRLAQAGIGLWPDFAADTPDAATIEELQSQLRAIGYDCPVSDALDAPTQAVVTAFQRHFRPARCDGVADDETRRRIAILARSV
ncbi:MAG TPA: N-acetylmuramoyl-L-alanine amidase [Stellaceae bacterium]|jgi:N-acetylmuramoyl-L-alanine amidase|nr:N-acetylmuramoyl-L-alanine amidase [Stellaceae bacterium]